MRFHNSDPITSGPGRLLGVWAHPDDEAYLSAGLMAEVVASGGHVTVVVLTDGELGFADDDDRSPAVRSRLRRAEMREAMATIGVTDVRFLGFPDGAVGRVDTSVLVAPIVEVMTEVRPELTVTFGPDGITGHDDHIATGHAATAAWLEYGAGALAYGTMSADYLAEWRDMHDELGIWMTGEPEGSAADEVAFAVSLRGADLDRKRAVLACHASQTAGLAELIGEERYRAWIAGEWFRRPTETELSAALAARSLGLPWPTLARRQPSSVA